MAKVRVTGVKNAVKKAQKDAVTKASRSIFKNRVIIENEIIATILSGQSPVAGKTWDDYSSDYANRKKGGSRKPVDMFDTGKMLKSLRLKRLGNDIIISFSSPIARYHDKLGAGINKIIRRLLPRKGEKFKKNIMDVIRKAARKS